jgi:putative ABC transport system permease protein
MLLNYLLTVWRNFRRNKLFTLLNISGLAIGMVACLLIAQYVLHELSYDNFWPNRDRVFRVQLDRYNKGELATRWAGGALGIGPDLKADFPEVEHYVRLAESTALLSSDNETFFKETGVWYASKDFFNVFGHSLVNGVDSTALKYPNQIVLSETMARKYFGEADPMGKTIMNKKVQYVVTGVFADLPANTHMQVDALMSFATFARLIGRRDESELTQWQWDGYKTYVLLKKSTDAASLEAKLPEYVLRKVGEELKEDNSGMVFYFVPLRNIHLDSNVLFEFKVNGSRETTYFLTVVAILILIIAWINYINLSTAKSIERAREVGVRKVMGGHRVQLMQQFMTESMVLNLAALALAVSLAAVLMPWFGDLVGRELGFGLFRYPGFWLAMVVLIAAGALLSGLYPAVVLSGYKPVEVLKGRFKNTGQGVYFRKGMVLVQFVASITLIVGTFTVYRQLGFVRSQKLGFNIDQTLVIWSPNNIDSTYRNKYDLFKNRLQRYAEITSVSASTSVPGMQPDFNAGGVRRLSQRPDEANQYRVIVMDDGLVPSFNLEVLAGRAFSAAVPNEEANVMMNEAAIRVMGYAKPEDAIGDQIFFWGDTLRIVGVVRNYRHESAKKAYDQLIFRYHSSPEGFYSIKFNAARVQESIAKFESDFRELFPGNPFNYFFLDEAYNNQYKTDQQFGKVFTVFAGLAIFIACLGLFGLSSLTAIQRTKEIGVRKVMGASVPGILLLVSRSYVELIGAAIIISIPVSWWIMTNWLEGFATRIPLSWPIFAVPSLLVIVLALVTVGLHTLRAAKADPVKALRYE